MKYWVYMNRPEPKAKIQKESCSHCNEGRGCHNAPRQTEHGEWLGPFSTLEEAELKAKKTGKPVSYCKHCF